jgi:hypothetical protein
MFLKFLVAVDAEGLPRLVVTSFKEDDRYAG